MGFGSLIFMNDEDRAQVVAMQFAGGMSVAQLAEEWERDAAWVEAAIRRTLLETIPERDGGLKVPRAEERAMRSEDEQAAHEAQGELWA